MGESAEFFIPKCEWPPKADWSKDLDKRVNKCLKKEKPAFYMDLKGIMKLAKQMPKGRRKKK